ncbi:methionyl-tRNA formyltransferase [Azospirillum sp. sgz302134]
MRVAVIGRTRALLAAGERLLEHGHEIPVVWTCRAEAFYGVGPEDFAKLARRAGAAFFDDLAINTPGNVARLASFGCRAAISMNWLALLGPALLDAFPLGVFNAHAGDLPRYRGNACPNWAILNGEPHVGLCIHRMAEELDAGPVVVRDRFPLGPDTYIGDVYAWMDERIPQMFVMAIDGLENGTIEPQPQSDDPAAALRVYPRRPSDARIDWTAPAETILRLVRASSRPFDGAFTTLEGETRITVWRAQRTQHPGPFLAVPGQVCYGLDGDPVVACGDGVLRLTEVEASRGEASGMPGSDTAKPLILKSLRNRLL